MLPNIDAELHNADWPKRTNDVIDPLTVEEILEAYQPHNYVRGHHPNQYVRGFGIIPMPEFKVGRKVTIPVNGRPTKGTIVGRDGPDIILVDTPSGTWRTDPEQITFDRKPRIKAKPKPKPEYTVSRYAELDAVMGAPDGNAVSKELERIWKTIGGDLTTYWGGPGVDGKDVALANIKELSRGLLAFKNDFPDLAKTIQYYGMLPSYDDFDNGTGIFATPKFKKNSLPYDILVNASVNLVQNRAYATTSNAYQTEHAGELPIAAIVYNPDIFRTQADVVVTYLNDIGAGYHPPLKDKYKAAFAVATHELGHVFQYKVKELEKTKNNTDYPLSNWDLHVGPNKDQNTQAIVSEYGRQSEPERFAEAYGDYLVNGNTPNRDMDTDVVGKVIEAYRKRKLAESILREYWDIQGDISQRLLEYVARNYVVGHHPNQYVKGLGPKQRVFKGKPVKIKPENQLNTYDKGNIGELIALHWLLQNGFTDAIHANIGKPNYPIDIIAGGYAIEVKAGSISNMRKAEWWRLTQGKPGPAERAYMDKLSPKALARWNKNKQVNIVKRKELAIKDLEPEYGVLKPMTIGIILNEDNKIADIHVFEGYHDTITWYSEMAEKGYKGTYNYAAA